MSSTPARLPIIFYHFGNARVPIETEIEIALHQATVFNDEVYFITNQVCNVARVIRVEAEELPIYRSHLIPACAASSDMPGAARWFLRWYLTLKLCKEKNITSFATFDTDVLIYEDLKNIPGIRSADLLTGRPDWVGQAVINNFRVLERFVELQDDVFVHKRGPLYALFEQNAERKRQGLAVGHGFCDMDVCLAITNSKEFSYHQLDEKSPICIFGLKDTLDNDGYAISIEGGKACGVHPKLGKRTFATLHFSGAYKIQLPFFTSAGNLSMAIPPVIKS